MSKLGDGPWSAADFGDLSIDCFTRFHLTRQPAQPAVLSLLAPTLTLTINTSGVIVLASFCWTVVRSISTWARNAAAGHLRAMVLDVVSHLPALNSPA